MVAVPSRQVRNGPRRLHLDVGVPAQVHAVDDLPDQVLFEKRLNYVQLGHWIRAQDLAQANHAQVFVNYIFTLEFLTKVIDKVDVELQIHETPYFEQVSLYAWTVESLRLEDILLLPNELRFDFLN